MIVVQELLYIQQLRNISEIKEVTNDRKLEGLDKQQLPKSENPTFSIIQKN